MNEISDKILPYEARAEFCDGAEFCHIFCSFFGQWSFKKNAFEIYWPLANLRNHREIMAELDIINSLVNIDNRLDIIR